MFDVPSLDEIPEDLRARIKEVAEKSGFVPNIFLSLARRPAEWRAFFAYHDALMDKETPALSKGDRELIVVATSAENHCLYCVVAHGALARIQCTAHQGQMPLMQRAHGGNQHDRRPQAAPGGGQAAPGPGQHGDHRGAPPSTSSSRWASGAVSIRAASARSAVSRARAT